MVDKPQRQKPAFLLPRPAIQRLKDELVTVAISAMAQPIVDGLFAQWAADPRILVSRKTSQDMGDHGPSHEIDLERANQLEAILVDGQKRVVVDSIYRRLILKTIESYPADGPMKKARLPPSMHQPKVFGHGGTRVGAKLFQPKARPAAPPPVHERVATPSPVSTIKRGRGRPPGKRVAQPVASIDLTPAE